ncbi:NAD(P)-dependent oxidoreductase [Streptomyces sp. L-9-10]|uniref:NAD(P)-dependent oxidoreductase n=1 Tax=Streptomyces sp. L-9-10 TaxID=1478131 RepID=UPI00101DE706|nr:NAD(P)-dependent oxidoreductase [Streptomyces sp. L-9-10]
MTNTLSPAAPVAHSGAGHAARAGDLPVLQSAQTRWPMPPARLVLVTHLLDTAVPYVRLFDRCMDLVGVVPVPYSVQPEALSRLDDLPVTVPESIGDVGTFAVRDAVRAARESELPVVVQEVGGYCADAVGELAQSPSVRGIVEDTKQGQWRYERNMPLPLPVFTIADSPLKALEDVQVGRSVAYSVERLLRLRFYRLLSERRVLVLGYGGIGTALAEHLRRTGAQVAVYDPDEVRMSAAVVHGFRVGARKDLLGWAEVIVGVSGHRALTTEDLPLLRDGVVLASGSSKQVEFDVEGLCHNADTLVETDEVMELQVAGRTVYLLNQGKPVNFLEQSILGSVLDLVYTELYLCTRELARRAWSPGLHRLDPRMQQELAQQWREEYGRQW